MRSSLSPEDGVPFGETGSTPAPPCEVLFPREQRLPLVLASPHSGSEYPSEFLALSRLDYSYLRRSEDSFIDEVFAAAAELGAPLLRARFPRAYVDANREPFELDAQMFDDPLPAYVNTRSPRVAAGLGTIARTAANGEEIYRGKLRFADALHRIETLYRPYHAALRRLVDDTRARFGFCILLDCHSMPSAGGEAQPRAGREADVVLGDCFGFSCAPALTARAHETLRAAGFSVSRNRPYSGGFTTRHYGRPEEGVHGLQIEINRALYMDQQTLRRGARMDWLASRMAELVTALGRIDAHALRAAASGKP
jgi:N-formylglutamate amidohydrolase